MIAYAILVLNVQRGLGMFIQHINSGTDALQAASYHYFLAKFVGQVCIDEKLILRGAEGTSTSVDDAETPAQILMNIALTNFDMLRSKFKNYCSKHESEADEDDDDGRRQCRR